MKYIVTISVLFLLIVAESSNAADIGCTCTYDYSYGSIGWTGTANKVLTIDSTGKCTASSDEYRENCPVPWRQYVVLSCKKPDGTQITRIGCTYWIWVNATIVNYYNCGCAADKEMVNGICVPKCVEPEIRNPVTGECVNCPSDEFTPEGTCKLAKELNLGPVCPSPR